MTGYHRPIALLISGLLLLAAAPVVAQEAGADEANGSDGPTIDVIGVDYAFTDLPTSVPEGTTLTFTNDGTEFHEMVALKINDETTPLAELMALPEEEAADITEFTGFLSAFPGTPAEGSIPLTAAGRYVVLCLINQGSNPAAFHAVGFDPSMLDENTDPSTLPPEVQELLTSIESNPQHFELGMVQEFTVTDAGTEVGPLPGNVTDETPPEDSADA